MLRLFGTALFKTNTDDLLQFERLDVGASRTGETYLLLLHDDRKECS